MEEENKTKDIKLGIYKHFKGNFYKLIAIARNSENPEEEFVVYQALYEHPKFGKNTIWVRPKSMFFEIITKDGKTFPRFQYMGDYLPSC
ncbi:MAG: DUF1653 domain-containing protein [Candidatus Pacearchaeota archaeon]|nr:DUF1653 domain-containing protein [Candidatus Pacearchaeota archaeon]